MMTIKRFKTESKRLQKRRVSTDSASKMLQLGVLSMLVWCSSAELTKLEDLKMMMTIMMPDTIEEFEDQKRRTETKFCLKADSFVEILKGTIELQKERSGFLPLLWYILRSIVGEEDAKKAYIPLAEFCHRVLQVTMEDLSFDTTGQGDFEHVIAVNQNCEFWTQKEGTLTCDFSQVCKRFAKYGMGNGLVSCLPEQFTQNCVVKYILKVIVKNIIGSCINEILPQKDLFTALGDAVKELAVTCGLPKQAAVVLNAFEGWWGTFSKTADRTMQTLETALKNFRDSINPPGLMASACSMWQTAKSYMVIPSQSDSPKSGQKLPPAVVEKLKKRKAAAEALGIDVAVYERILKGEFVHPKSLPDGKVPDVTYKGYYMVKHRVRRRLLMEEFRAANF